ncbi:MAG: hypothetical protein OXC41_07545, partial [Gammaproteobacteria bacterium]|nr:hypothetical protein [Gammaproteobacteria bacterium]
DGDGDGDGNTRSSESPNEIKATNTDFELALSEQGDALSTGTTYSFDNWGFWASQGSQTLYSVGIRGNGSNVTPYSLHVEGTPSDMNPSSGSAVWSGGLRAYETDNDSLGVPVSGEVRLEVDFSSSTLDIDFTNLTEDHNDMAWRELDIINGTFRHDSGAEFIDGAFYGDDHEGAGGKFEQGRLRGVFGTIRE